jgi:hypothetical protein
MSNEYKEREKEGEQKNADDKQKRYRTGLGKHKKGEIDAAGLSEAHIVDTLLLTMQKSEIVEGIKEYFPDKRERKGIPFTIIMLLAIAAKMKVATSLSDIPFAITDVQTIYELGYAMWDSERDLREGLMDEGTVRHLVGAYDEKEWIEGYNRYVQEHVMLQMDIRPQIHIVDCTKIEVNLKNERYEGSKVTRDEEGMHRGYKLSTLRGIWRDRGIIEEIRYGSIETHDLRLSREMIENSQALKEGDILINDRGFLSREMVNKLKKERGVNSYLPLRKDMDAYKEAVALAKEAGKWIKHPNPKRKHQQIAQVEHLEIFRRSDHPAEDVEMNGCVVWDKQSGEYFVFVTTDTSVSAKQIIKTYELRPEIEEDYRQIKDFWKIENFRSRKLTVIVFHIICTLLGYLFFQLYTAMEEGSEWAGKSLPVVIKKYNPKQPTSIILCVGRCFATFPLLEFLQLYASCDIDIRLRLDPILALL